jgi:ATP-dependent DNA ligase
MGALNLQIAPTFWTLARKLRSPTTVLRRPTTHNATPRRNGHPLSIADRAARLAVAYLSRMPKCAFDPCIPTRGTKVPNRPEWLHEIKYDGYRLIVQREGQRVRLFTRNGYDWSAFRSSSRPHLEIARAPCDQR